MRTLVGVMMAGALMASAGMAQAPVAGAGAGAGRGGDKQQPIGAAARAKHGPDPMAAPPPDVGMAEDPVGANGQGTPPAPRQPALPKAITPK